MLRAIALAQPDLIICPFLTTLIPAQIHENYLTLIIHPGPPGDAGPSSLDWLLLGDDGSVDDASELLAKLDSQTCRPGRTHWGVTVLQAIEELDEGPVWAFEQFPIDIDTPGLSKSELYRGAVSRAAIDAVLAAISRIQNQTMLRYSQDERRPSNSFLADSSYGEFSISEHLPYQGGRLHHRPLLKASQREFDPSRHDAQQISRRIHCSDSQPGALSKVFDTAMYVYGGILEENVEKRVPRATSRSTVSILGTRQNDVCVAACDGKGVWITHVRRPKTSKDPCLWPKVPAVAGLVALGVLDAADVTALQWDTQPTWSLSPHNTYQEIWIDMNYEDRTTKTAYLYFDFYNGAMSTAQCSHLIQAMEHIVSQSTPEDRVKSVVLMGGTYFSNGIALNVIEAAADPAKESWLNINRIDDVVHYILHELPSHGITTVAAMRGSAAAGGVALAAACDVVISGSDVVLNPAYRAMGLSGSEFHTISYSGRCGKTNAERILRDMMPMSAHQAQTYGLVDYVLPGSGVKLDHCIRDHVSSMSAAGVCRRPCWKQRVDLSPSALASARTNELHEMALDFWSARSSRYHKRRFAFVRKVKPAATPLRFALHRRAADPYARDEEEHDSFTSLVHFQRIEEARLLSSSGLQSHLPDTARQQSLSLISAGPLTPVEEVPMLFSCYYHQSPVAPTTITLPMTPDEADRGFTVSAVLAKAGPSS